jgi:hypothetical protein
MKKLALLVPLLLVLALAYCSRSAPEPQIVPGKNFNSAFPKSGGGLTVQFTQEKEGYAQADLLKDGKKMAQLSISDTDSNPSARDKFKPGARTIAGHPSATVGSLGTAILVGNRYQVQVRSIDPGFTAQEREAWLTQFQLGGLK